ncbi:MAG: hypothetical protein GY772_20500, partial [bacterium]|nr:hypothetical protein [bacterium]
MAAIRQGFQPRQMWECGIPDLPLGALAPSAVSYQIGQPSGARLLYTDGSVLRASDPAVARAGWGYTDGLGHGCFGTLPGYAQTINRAELWSVVTCASAQSHSHIICTDSQYVVQGASSIARGLDPDLHGDLWSRFRALPVKPWLIKVAAHLSVEEAASRGQPEAVRLGNATADRYARCGASVSPPAADALASRVAALTLASRVQDAQWQLLRAILNAEKRPFGAS